MGLLVETALERRDAKVTVVGGQRRARHAADQRLGPHPVFDQLRDGDHRERVPLREPGQFRHPGHRPVLVHDFADHARRREARDARQVDGRLGLACAHQHTAGARPQRGDVPGADQVRSRGGGIDGGEDRRRAIGGGNPRRDVVLGVDRDAKGGAELRGVVGHRQRQLEFVQARAGHRQADLPAAVLRHEIDDLRGDLLRRDRQVALVLAVLIVDHDDHAAVPDRLDGVLDGGERSGGLARCHLPLATSIARSTYLPSMSHSRLTESLTFAKRRLVCSQV